MIPEVLLAPELPPALLRERIGEFENLVHEKSEHVQEEEVEGEVFLPVAAVCSMW